jgi:RNA polymerase sigma factor (sigma-70 family)
LSETVFNRLVSEYLAMRTELVRFLTARLGQAPAAEDIYQEIFIRLKNGQLPEDVGNTRAFIYRMAYNLANDLRRTGQRRAARDGAWFNVATQTMGPEAVSDHPDADDAIDAKRKLDALLAGVAELPAKCREVFTLHRLQGLSHRDIAAHLGITTKTVEKHMTTALKHLTLKMARRAENAEETTPNQTQGGGRRGA